MTAVAVENEKPVAAKRSNTCSSQANPASLFIHAEAEFEKKTLCLPVSTAST
jgi:hypothetical protein